MILEYHHKFELTSCSHDQSCHAAVQDKLMLITECTRVSQVYAMQLYSAKPYTVD